MTRIFATNFNKNYTGVSATVETVLKYHCRTENISLVGQPLPSLPSPITLREARRLSRSSSSIEPTAIWHVRRNTEMRAAIFTRDVLRCPIKLVFTSAAKRLHSAYPRWLISKMNAVIATSNEAASFVPNVYAVIPHGVDTEIYHPSENQALDWKSFEFPGKAGVATIGRVRPEKGTDIFVDAMLELLPYHPDIVALIVGRTAAEHRSFEKSLKTKIETAGLSGRILFIGEMPAAKMPHLMRSLSLVMQLSRYEGYGMVPLEALASGVPFVATDTGAYQIFANASLSGAIVATASEAAQAAHHFLNCPPDARELHLKTERYFSAATEASAILSVYDLVLKAKPN